MERTGASIRTIAGYLGGVVLGTTAITLLFLGMRAVMDVGGACADGGPYVSAQPCPTGVPLAMIGGMFGLFGAAGLLMWFGSQIGSGAAAIVALGWPALFLALGWNFLDYAFRPPNDEPTPVWGWLIPGVLFWIIGAGPLAVAIAAWRAARGDRTPNRLSARVATGLPVRLRPAGPTAAQAAGLTSEPVLATDPDARPVHAPESALDLAGDLARLAELYAAGDLTDDEFARAKRERLGAIELPPS